MRLTGKTALVTGGSRGIGRAICLELARQGASVAVNYSGSAGAAEQTVQACRAVGAQAFALQADVASSAACQAMLQAVLERFGRLDILVCNAGVARDELMLRLREEDFDTVINTNLKGTFNMIRQCTPIFMKNRHGKIINISSVAGLMGNPGQANYAASKAGVVGLTKSVARELASRNVCCNAIAPGMIQTDMTASFSEDDAIVQQIPLGRMGKPEEIAELAAFLADSGSDYITGEVIRVDGGLAI